MSDDKEMLKRLDGYRGMYFVSWLLGTQTREDLEKKSVKELIEIYDRKQREFFEDYDT